MRFPLTPRRATGAAAILAALALAGPAHAEIGNPGAPGYAFSTPAGPQGSHAQAGSNGRGRTIAAGGCSLSAGPGGMGASCSSTTDLSDPATIAQLLGGQPFQNEWYVPLTPEELDAVAKENTPGPDGITWYWKFTISGIDPTTLKVDKPPVQLHQELAGIHNTRQPGEPAVVAGLNPGMARMIKVYARRSVIPEPVLATGPTDTPRVDQVMAFWTATPTAPEVSVGGATLRAEVMSITGDFGPGDTVTCAGPGAKVSDGVDPSGVPGACRHIFTKSSVGGHDDAGTPDKVSVGLTVHWRVTYRIGGGAWQTLTEFDKTAVTSLAVDEIQSLVVP